MSGEGIGIAGYEPGRGFQPARLGISLSEFLTLVAANAIVALLRAYLGNQAALAVLGAVWGAAFLAGGTRRILNAERLKAGKTEKGARRVRIEGIVALILGAALMTLAICSIVFLAEGW